MVSVSFPFINAGRNPIIKGITRNTVQPYYSNIPISIYPKIAETIKVIKIENNFGFFFIF